MRTLSALAVVASALAAQSPAAQQSIPSRAENARVLRGQVRSDDINAVPLRRARLVVAEGEPVFTDSEGRFALAIPSMPATLRVTKPGFAPRHIALAASSGDPIDIRLPRGAAVVGGVFDELNGPASGVTVRVRRIDESAPERVPVDAAVQTDDLGEFRIGSLPEGEYVIATSGNDSRSVAPRRVHLRAGEEVGVALLHDLRTEEAREAASYAAGAEAARDARGARLQTSGTATVRGSIIDPNGRPLAGAVVRLDPASAGVARIAASDAQGHFQFAGVARGTYRVRASKEGFLAGEYGPERAAQSFRQIIVRDGQQVDDVDIRLPRGAVVTGNVVDAAGEPIEGLAMHVWQVNNRSGGRFAESVLNVAVRRTDDRGNYRLHGLQPGTYYVVAADHPAAGRPAAQVPDAARSYYPGVGMIGEAGPIKVDAGLDAAGTDFTFRTTRTWRVSGEARTSQGEPLNRPVTLAGSTRPGLVGLPPMEAVQTGRIFEFKHVPRGAYVLQGIYVIPGPSGPEAFESATLPVTVPDGDIKLATVVTSPGSTVTGYVVAEGVGLPLLQGQWLDVMPVNPDEMPHRTPRPWTVRTSAEGAFQIAGLQGQMRFVGTAATPEGWWLKSVEIDGRNATTIPASFNRDVHRTDVRAVLSDAGAEVSGRALDGRKEPVATYVAIAFPVDSGRWYPGSRHVIIARPSDEMQFRLGPLPPGDYWLAAVDALEDRSILDPDVLRRLTAIARRVTLSTGQAMVTDLSIGRIGR